MGFGPDAAPRRHVARAMLIVQGVAIEEVAESDKTVKSTVVTVLGWVVS